MTLKVTLLGRRQGVIENGDIEAVVGDRIADLVRLAGADEQGSIRSGTLTRDDNDRVSAGRSGQQGKFFEACGKIAFAEIDAYQYSTHVSTAPAG
ncbi:hypothetical protein GCM10011430_17000 [Oxalicibacterium solurbis]|uniref:Uncharacterized protein n=1 Tax=Oxalicibacterium solurbis TaxID=69280 RepID=A0A8J3F6E2_9BURK|nr:hypothetical protein GCM10011430_17000 [Oxalicibacterium solurbis]